MNTWTTIPDVNALNRTVAALKENGIEALVVNNGEEAKKKVFEILPEGAEIMTMTSVTLDTLGITKEINSSNKYKNVRKEFDVVDEREKKHLGAAPDWTIGSVHAVTEDGHVLIASNTGSQLPAYAYGANHIIWVVGAQKITKDFEDAMKRLYEHTLPLESERAHKAYGVQGSFISKLLVVNKEIQPGRITLILVKENLGF
jgi:hypothetical protein